MYTKADLKWIAISVGLIWLLIYQLSDIAVRY